MVLVPPGKLCPSPVSQLYKNMVSYDGNMMLAMAVVSLVLVVAFVFLLHFYAKWLLVQARHRSTTSGPPSPRLSGYHLNRYITYEASQPSDDFMITFKGLAPSVIALIPLFVYNGEGATGLECVICMGQFEDKEVGRELPNCGHSFHVECIDMWLLSHTNCPLCRSNVGLLIQCEEEEEEVEEEEEEEEGKEKFSSSGDCPEVNISSSTNNHHNDAHSGLVLEIVIEVPGFVENMNDE